MTYSAEKRTCQNCKGEFVIDPDDFSFYEKIHVPPPTFCPECRMQRRFAWRNERSLYKRKNNAPGGKGEIISMYSSDSPYIVYDKEYWWSDKWDPMSFGREYDFSRPFFEQFYELLKSVPMQSLQLMNSPDAQYSNYIDNNKNCYLVFGLGFSENVRYSNRSSFCKDSQDLLASPHNELCYDLVDCSDCYDVFSSENCTACVDSGFLYNCRNCTNCFGCSNLASKSYCFFNIQLSKEEYLEKIKSLDLGDRSNFLRIKSEFYEKVKGKAIRRYANIFQSVNCTGHNISKSKNSRNCFDIREGAEDSRYSAHSLKIKDTYDVYGNYDSELFYEGVDNDAGFANLSTITVYNSNNCSYCFTCQSSSDLFGCSGLRGKSYCILNKQYSRDEYVRLKSEIIKHMSEVLYRGARGRVYGYGEFFPIEISPFAYNETIAQEIFPLSESQARDMDYRWREMEEKTYVIEVLNKDIQRHIKNFSEDHVGKVLECAHQGKCNEQCTRAFKVIPEEYAFYKKMNLPPPLMCHNCRHYERLRQKNPFKLWHRSCMCEKINHAHHLDIQCPREFETPYAPDRPEVVYCEKCYQQEVY